MWRDYIAVVWHWLTTSRYTRRLEAEIAQLRSDNDRLRGDNDALLKALYPAIKAARTEPTVSEGPKNLKTFKW